MKRFYLLIIVVFIILFNFTSCNNELIILPNIKLAINYERPMALYDDQLYTLHKDGTLSVLLCRLNYDNPFEFFEYYDSEGNIAPCMFTEKTIKLSTHQKKILRDLFLRLFNKDEIKQEVPFNVIPGEIDKYRVSVFIQLENGTIPYFCAGKVQ